MRKVIFQTGVAACMMLGQFLPAQAFEIHARLENPGEQVWIPEGDHSVPPLAFVRFCMSYPDDCRQNGNAAIVALDDDLRTDLAAVNEMVNGRIKPNAASRGELPWSLETTFGDCNDFAVQKRHELLQRGWPMSALSLAVATTRSGVGHLVLTVRTTEGDFVLDNLKTAILTWDQTGYSFLRRQAIDQPRYWVEIDQFTNIRRAQMPNVELVTNWKLPSSPWIKVAQVSFTLEPILQ